MNYLKFSRRYFLGSAVMVGTGLAFSASGKNGLMVTPPHTEGPFYPVVEQADKDADLTVFGENKDVADGEIIVVEGRVLDTSGIPIPGATVDVWQANAAGKYAHERDSSTAPLDPNFQGWAILKTDSQGRYRFKTVKPGAYPIDANWTRPPHIHFKVSRRGYKAITTQMYFENEPLNAADSLLNALPKEQQPSLIATRTSKIDPFQFNLVLAKT